MKTIPDPNRMKKIKGPVLTKLQLKSSKIRITTYLDRDILEALRLRAKKTGNKYQTLLNQILRHNLFKKEDLHERLGKLEKIIYKKRVA